MKIKLKRIVLIILSSVIGICCMIGFCGCNNKYTYSKNLINAIENNDMEELASLINEARDLNAKPYPFYVMDVANHTPVSVAADKGNFEAVKMLVEAGANLNIAGSNGWTPLHRSIKSVNQEDFQIAYYLIEHGANIHAKDNGGNTAIGSLMNAYVQGQQRKTFFLFLLENGASLEDSAEGHILFDACYNDSNVEIVNYILENYDVDINMRSQYKNGKEETLLMKSTYRNALQICQLLLKHGANKLLENKQGETAYNLAVQYGSNEVAELLK